MRGYAAIGLYSPKNGLNIGGALRAAHCFDARMVIVEAPRFQRQASNVTEAQRHIPTIVGSIVEHRPHDCPMVVVELVDGASSLVTFEHPERGLYVFGPEDGSVPVRLVERAQHVVSIPTAYCLNLAATVNIVLYDRLVKRAARTTGVRRAA